MKLEISIERRTVRLLKVELDLETVKVGHRGWPDRLVLLPNDTHVWFEFKRPDGSLTPAQKRRIPRLRNRGEWVIIITSAEQGVQVARICRDRVRAER